MSDTSSGWTTSDDDSSGNEYSVRTKKDKLEELEQQKLNKKAKKKKKKHKRNKKSKYKSDISDSENEFHNKKNNNIITTTCDNMKSETNNDDMKYNLLKNGPLTNSISTPYRRQSPLINRSRKNSRSRSLSKDRKSGRSVSHSRSPKNKQSPSPTKPKQKAIPASYRSPESQKSKARSKSRSCSKSRSRSRSRIRSRSRDKTWRSSITRRRSISKDKRFNKRTTFGYNRWNRERSRDRKFRSRSRERRNRSRSRERRNRSRSRERRNRSRSNDRGRTRSRSYDGKRFKSGSPLLKKDGKSPNLTTNKTSTSWDVKVTPTTPTSSITNNGTIHTTGVGVFVPISTDNNYNKDKDKIDQVFTHFKSLSTNQTSKGGIEIKIPPSPTVEKDKEDPKSHLYGKWEAYERPQDKAKTALNKFTRMCQEISAKEGIEEPERRDSKNEPVHHPFTVNQAPSYAPPVVPIKTPTTPAEAIMAGSMLSLMAPTVEAALSGPLEKHFPVSSGTDHRAKCNATETDIGLKNTPVYEENKPQEEINVSAVIARRLGAQQILTLNPNDYSATLVMTECDQKLKKWSDMNKTPGKFTGEVGVKMNKKEMFTVGSNESIVRKDFFHNLRPVTGGIGMKMLQNMGWKEGQPLGKSMQGFVAPISIDVKVGRAGLSAAEEIHRNQWSSQYQTPTSMPMPMPLQKKKAAPPVVNVGGKHPVSALAEICTKRKMARPEYAVLEESGPSFAKVFLMKVQVENIVYQPNEPSPNKKHAKAMAATLALQSLGLLDEPTC